MLPGAVQRVADFLRDSRAEATIEEFPNGTPTAEAAARATGVEPARIVKSLVFLCDGRPVLSSFPATAAPTTRRSGGRFRPEPAGSPPARRSWPRPASLRGPWRRSR